MAEPPIPIDAANVKAQIVREIYNNTRRRFPRRKIYMAGINESLQIDLMDLRNLASHNRGHKFALFSICTFSKKLHVVPLKTKTTNEVTDAMESILKKIMPPPVRNIWSDRGLEFTSKRFTSMLDSYGGIKLCHSYQITKACIAERVIRTIKTWLFKRLLYFKTKRWIDHIQHIVDYYNSKVHRTIGMAPNDVTPHNEKQLLTTVYNYNQELPSVSRSKFRVGQHVRISKHKATFARGFHPQFSPEIFKVVKVRNTTPLTYMLTDVNDAPIVGSFYAEELTHVKYPNSYLVEKVLKKKGDQIYAKYLGVEEPFWSKEI